MLYENTDIQFSDAVVRQVKEMKPFEISRMLGILYLHRAEIFDELMLREGDFP